MSIVKVCKGCKSYLTCAMGVGDVVVGLVAKWLAALDPCVIVKLSAGVGL